MSGNSSVSGGWLPPLMLSVGRSLPGPIALAKFERSAPWSGLTVQTGIKQFRIMSPDNLRMGGAIALIAGIAAALMVIQHRAMRQLREENTSLHGQIGELAELARANEVLSNRLAQANTAQFAPNDPSHEVLRLRGEVGVLRQQLKELQQLTSAQSPEGPQAHLPASAETSRKMEALLIQIQAEYGSVKALSDKLQEKASDREALVQGILASGFQDDLLRSLLEQREIAALKLGALPEDRNAQDPEIQALSNQVAELTARIGERSQGILLSLNAKADAMKGAVENLQGELGKAKGISQ
jgi:hypothetical protein